MVGIDTVYQKVLALANKEQRGYITPQEFNLMADKAQFELFDAYFHALKTVDIKPKTHYTIDNIEDIEMKLQPFKKLTSWSQNAGDATFDWPSDLYRLDFLADRTSGVYSPIEEMSGHDLLYSNQHPLTKPTKNRMVFERTSSDVEGKFWPNPTDSVAVDCSYYRIPVTPKWAYVVVEGRALYNATNSINFELHQSEEEVLVSKILALAGVVIMSSESVQYGGGMEQAIKQEQNS